MPLPPDTPPPVGPIGLAMRVAIQGRDAYDAGLPVAACPYGPTRPFARRAWLAGYRQGITAGGRRTPADAADDVDEDAPAPNA